MFAKGSTVIVNNQSPYSRGEKGIVLIGYDDPFLSNAGLTWYDVRIENDTDRPVQSFRENELIVLAVPDESTISRTVAEKMAPVFKTNGWEWAIGDTLRVPTVDEITKQIDSLVERLRNLPDSISVSTGRIIVARESEMKEPFRVWISLGFYGGEL